MIAIKNVRFARKCLGVQHLLCLGLALCLNSSVAAEGLPPSAEGAVLVSEVAPESIGGTQSSQVIYLNFNGAFVREFDGPMAVVDLAIPPFKTWTDDDSLDDNYIIDFVLSQLETSFANHRIDFTTEPPSAETDFSTIIVGGTNSRFEEMGDYVAIAQHIDFGNVDKNDVAFVFSELVAADTDSSEEFVAALIIVISKTTSLLIGKPYEGFDGTLSAVSRACSSTYCIDDSTVDTSINVYPNKGGHTYEIDAISRNICTQWRVNGTHRETDHSGFFANDPQYSHTCTPTTVVAIVGRVYENDSCTGSSVDHTFNVTCKAPDVYVSTLTFTPTLPGTNDSVKIEANSCNRLGNKYASTGFDLDYRVKINGSVEKIGSHTFGLSAGECDKESFSHVFGECGSFTIEWCEDYTNEETEWDEGDNCKSLVINIAGECCIDSDCPDRECKNGTCNNGTCGFVNKPNGSSCGSSNNTVCDDPDTCESGNCLTNPAIFGTPCAPDTKECTNDECNGSGSCRSMDKPNGTSCGSNNNTDCDDPDSCQNGSCAKNYKPTNTACTTDSEVCTNDVCNSSGVCGHLPNSKDCTDNDGCTVGDTCSGGNCLPGPQKDCDDLDPCTDDSCLGGLCVNTYTCPCQKDADCNDFNPCTINRCENGECKKDNNTETCDDGLFCNGTDVCNGGNCTHSGNPCPSTESCDESLGACTGTCCIGLSCSITSEVNCTGVWTLGESCIPDICGITPTGSCHVGSSCSITTQANCSGVWTSGGNCNTNTCPSSDFHPADMSPYCGCLSSICEDFQLDVCEILAYAREWINGIHDDLECVLRGALIWKQCGTYIWNPVTENWDADCN